MIEQKEACVLATLFLHSSGAEVSKANIGKILSHLGVAADGYLVDLFAKVRPETLESLISNPAGGAAATAPLPAAEAAGQAAAKKVEEEKEEEEESGDFDLF